MFNIEGLRVVFVFVFVVFISHCYNWTRYHWTFAKSKWMIRKSWTFAKSTWIIRKKWTFAKSTWIIRKKMNVCKIHVDNTEKLNVCKIHVDNTGKLNVCKIHVDNTVKSTLRQLLYVFSHIFASLISYSNVRTIYIQYHCFSL